MFRWSLIFIFLLCLTSLGSKLAFALEEVKPSSGHSHLSSTYTPSKVVMPSNSASNYKGLKGWDHLFNLLIARGVDPNQLQKTLSDSKMPSFKPLYFSLDPKESRAAYRRRNRDSEIKNAVEFYRKHESKFIEAEERFQVPRSVILSILQMETRCGKFTGNSIVFHGLARLAIAADPDNIEKNFNRLKKKDKENKVTLTRVSERALWLENTFLPHVLATINVAQAKGLETLDLKGSYSGAIGLPQFLPGNQLTFGIDGNSDGEVDLFSPDDAIPSVANFLQAKGWNTMHPSTEEQEKVIWHYNRSAPYVETVLKIARRIDKALSQ
jgi:membrane-bound lytic murein transglycosylase B